MQPRLARNGVIKISLDARHEVRPTAADVSPVISSVVSPVRESLLQKISARILQSTRIGKARYHSLRLAAPHRRGATALIASGLLLTGVLGTATAAAELTSDSGNKSPKVRLVSPPIAASAIAEAEALAAKDAALANSVIAAAASRLADEQSQWRQQKAYAALMGTAGRTGVDWDGIAYCETEGNWSMSGPRYSGGVGFYNGTWEGFGGEEFAANAGSATRTEQIVVAERVHDAFGLSGWGCRAYG
ncbi:MAG: transglycosylase family protein [Acidimicrobiia bacterium]|nr:transglycosylase family protein [Acidimicrobiia bacterium]